MRSGLAYQKDIAQEFVLPVPIGGLNLNDSLANMPELDAYQMDNIFPGRSRLELRGGFAEQATAVGTSTVGVVAQYSFGATNQLIVGGSGTLYDATTAGTTATPVGSGYSANTWDTIMQRGTMLLFNGTDTPQQYNGTAATTASYTGISTPANLIKANQYRSRLYLTEKNYLGYYYGGVDSITGALTNVNLSGVFKNGGYTMWTATITRDSGDGQDDLFVVASSNNELLVYEGSFPDDPSWNKVGLYHIPDLLGRNSYINVGSDLLLLTSSGLIPISSIMQMGTVVNDRQKVSNKINSVFPFLAKNYGGNDGWQMKIYPKGQYLLVNVPISPGSTYWQYVVNLQTGAWCRFLNQNGSAWGVYNNGLYFGGTDGTVFQADSGNTDAGAAIEFEYRQAYSTYGTPHNKLFNMIQPNITASASFILDTDIDVDFLGAPYGNPLQTGDSGAAEWDEPEWDEPEWGGDVTFANNYSGIGAYGTYGSIRQRGSVGNTSVYFNSNKVFFEPGGKL